MSEAPPALSNRLLSAALAQVGTHALILLDADGIVVDWLAGAERLFRYRPEEIVGQNISVLFTPEDLKNDLSNWEQKTAISAGESEDDRWQMRKDGGRIFVSGTLTALRDDDGEVIGFAKIMRDRTDQKFQVEALESRITAMKKSAERKEQFISTLGHELRNPLAAISYATHALKKWESDSPDMARTLELIHREITFMQRMIGDLLDAARFSAGKIRLRQEDVVMQEVIEAAGQTCRPSLDAKTQRLEQLLPEVPIHVQADPVRLQQVFVNLIDNASKFSEPGKRIWVTLTIEGDEAVTRVKDNGAGIPPEVMPHIFELFTQAETATPHEGLGIGLSVVKDTVALHGGTVQATSDGEGRGSEFTVRLPIALRANT